MIFSFKIKDVDLNFVRWFIVVCHHHLFMMYCCHLFTRVSYEIVVITQRVNHTTNMTDHGVPWHLSLLVYMTCILHKNITVRVGNFQYLLDEWFPWVANTRTHLPVDSWKIGLIKNPNKINKNPQKWWQRCHFFVLLQFLPSLLPTWNYLIFYWITENEPAGNFCFLYSAFSCQHSFL